MEILIRDSTHLQVVVHNKSRIARLAHFMPRWIVHHMESARIGNDTSYVRIHFRSPLNANL